MSGTRNKKKVDDLSEETKLNCDQNYEILLGKIEELMDKKFEKMTKTIDQTNVTIQATLQQLTTDTNTNKRIAMNNEHLIIQLTGDHDKMGKDLANAQIKNDHSINDLHEQISQLTVNLNDQKDRSMRDTLVIRGIAETEKETWKETSVNLINYIAQISTLSKDDIEYNVDRAHRGKATNPNRKDPRPIFVKFNTWKFAQEVMYLIIDSNKQRKSNVFVSQLYCEATTEKMNAALKMRKELIKLHPDTEMFVKYPGILLCRKRGSKEQYIPYK